MRPCRKTISFTLLLLVPHVTGCVPLRELPPSPRSGQPEDDVRGLILYDSTRYEFNRGARARWDDSTLVVTEPKDETTRYPVSQIHRLVVERPEDRAVVAILAVVGLGILTAIFVGISSMEVAPGG